jgi:hypothetical protein
MRFEVQRSVHLKLMEAGEPRELRLLSRNVSAEGAFLLTRLSLPLGARVQARLSLQPTGSDREVDLLVHGTIVRVDPEGVAINFKPGPGDPGQSAP